MARRRDVAGVSPARLDRLEKQFVWPSVNQLTPLGRRFRLFCARVGQEDLMSRTPLVMVIVALAALTFAIGVAYATPSIPIPPP
jgi:hypothetical protein